MAFDAPPGEQLSRFLTDRSHYSPAKGIVRSSAFYPPKSGRLSVYWTENILDAETWAIGGAHVAPSRGQILGRADFNSQLAYAAGLEVQVTGVPHPKHADIISWDVDRQKARLQAVQLADKSQFIPNPSS